MIKYIIFVVVGLLILGGGIIGYSALSGDDKELSPVNEEGIMKAVNEPQIRYTPNSYTECVNNVCNTQLYSYNAFTHDEGQWKRFSDVSDMTWTGQGFNMSYKNTWVVLEPFVVYNGNPYNVQAIREFFPNVNLAQYVSKNQNNNKFEFNFTNVPSNIIENIDYVGLRVIDSHNIQLSDIEIDSNKSRLIIKDKVELSYKDVLDNHYTLNLYNKTTVLIGNISANYENGIIAIDPTSQLKQTDDFFDGHMRSNAATTNYGTVGSEGIKAYLEANEFRGLIKFDLQNNIPSGATITKCDLKLYANYVAGSPPISVFNLSKDWVENQATWNIYSTGNSWDTAGAKGSGDASSTAQDTTTVTSSGSFYTWDLTDTTGNEDLCQKWFDGTYNNYGVLLAVDGGAGYRDTSYHASEYTSDLSLRPYVNLTYTYTSPCTGGVCTLDSTFFDSNLRYGESIFAQADFGMQFKIYVGDACTAAETSVDSATLELYIDGKSGSPDADARIWYIRDQNWDEQSTTTTLGGQTKYNQTSSASAWSSTTVNTKTNVSVTTQIQEACLRGDDYATVRIEDVDNLVGTIAGTDTNPGIGDGNIFSGASYSYANRLDSTSSRRPTLHIEYTGAGGAARNEFIDPTPLEEFTANDFIFFNMSVNETCATGDNALKVEIDNTNTTVCSNCPSSPPGFQTYNKTGVSDGNHTIAMWCNGNRWSQNWTGTESGDTNWANATAPEDNYHSPQTTFDINCTAYAPSGIINISLYSDIGRMKYDFALTNTSSFDGTNTIETINYTNSVAINDSYHYYCAANSSVGNWEAGTNGNKTMTVGVGKVYIVFASDTESKNRESQDGTFNMSLNFDNYENNLESETGMLFNRTWRFSLNDSTNDFPKITWYMMTHEAHGHAIDVNGVIPDVSYNVIADIMYDNKTDYSVNYYWRENVTALNDGYGWHNHHSFWNGTSEIDPNGWWVGDDASDFYFNGTELFFNDEYNETDFVRAEKLVSQFAYENGLPWTSFRAGWLQTGLGEHNENYMNFLGNNTAIDFTGLPAASGNYWAPTRFRDNNGRLTGFKCAAGVPTGAQTDNAFQYAQNGERVVFCGYGHNYPGSDMKQNIQDIYNNAEQNSSSYGVEYEWVNDLEAAQKWYRVTDTTPPEITVTINGDIVTAEFNEALHMPPSLSVLVNNGTTTNNTLYYMEKFNETRYTFNRSGIKTVALGYRVRATDKGFNVNTSSFLESSVVAVQPTTASYLSVFDAKLISVKYKFFLSGEEQTTGVDTVSLIVNGTDTCTLSGSTVYYDGSWEQNCTLPSSGYNETGFQDLSITANHTEGVTITQTETDSLYYPPADTCTYTGSGTWLVNCLDNCSISSTVVDGSPIIIYGDTGKFTIGGELSGFSFIQWENGCRISKSRSYRVLF